MAAPPLLTLRGITKAFPGVVANDRIDLDVHGREVHAIVGENGAGKSTLVKILYGFYRADAGEIRVDGVERVKAGEVFPLTELRKMDWLVEGVVGQPR